MSVFGCVPLTAKPKARLSNPPASYPTALRITDSLVTDTLGLTPDTMEMFVGASIASTCAAAVRTEYRALGTNM